MPSRRRSSVEEAHKIYEKYHKHLNRGISSIEDDEDSEDAAKKTDADAVPNEHPAAKVVYTADDFPQFHKVEKTGVIYATSRASKHGFHPEDPSWANMGQGAPETGPLPNAPSRSMTLSIPDAELEYAPVVGLKELRVKVADYYNHLYRQGKSSKYSYENVCIVPGGRAGLTRVVSILGSCSLLYMSIDYSAYEQQLSMFLRICPSPMLHRDVNEAIMEPEEFEFQCYGRGIGAVLMSNPANPTGQSVEGERLARYVETARQHQCAIIMDEFYSHYYYDGDAVDPADGGADDDSNWPKTVSSALYIDNVDSDPILIVNGLTKNWRCPGFRVCWIVAPKAIVQMLGSAGSYLDGGANAPLQRLALPLMELDFIRKDTWALQRHFRAKRDYLLSELAKLNITVKWQPTATFYIWADLSGLPPPLNDCLVFLEECVRHKVVCVPGVFFDINPRGIRNLQKSQSLSNVRFSYGPSMANLQKGMVGIRNMIQEWAEKTESADEYAHEKYE